MYIKKFHVPCTLIILLLCLESRFHCTINSVVTANFGFGLLHVRCHGSWNRFLKIPFLTRGVTTNLEGPAFPNDLALEQLLLSPEGLSGSWT